MVDNFNRTDNENEKESPLNEKESPLDESFQEVCNRGAKTLKRAAECAGDIAEKGLDKATQLAGKAAYKSLDVASLAADKFFDKINKLVDVVEKRIISNDVDFLSYRELIDLVIKNKPVFEDISRAAVVKRVLENRKVKLTIAYLDSEDRPIWKDSNGKELSVVVMANNIDDEIRELFGNRDTIIIE